MKSRIILVGGFLGAGKTTLLRTVAEKLSGDGTKVAMITNDQASALVDTGFLAKTGLTTKEVSGSCFCCNFPGFEEAIRSVMPEVDGGVILAEPVGSCTDLSATIVQTLKDHLAEELTISPLNVLTDPVRLEDILAGGQSGLHASSAYIVRKQMEEADYVLVNKIDTLPETKVKELMDKTAAAYPKATVMAISGFTGEGVDQWLQKITEDTAAGTHITDVDYDTYAEGEAVLGWLNTSMALSAKAGQDWAAFAKKILETFSGKCQEGSIGIGHVKLMIEGAGTFVSGNLTGGPETISVKGDDGRNQDVKLTFNARVEMAPEDLEKMALDMIADICGEEVSRDVEEVNSLMPGRPDPTYRYKEVV